MNTIMVSSLLSPYFMPRTVISVPHGLISCLSSQQSYKAIILVLIYTWTKWDLEVKQLVPDHTAEGAKRAASLYRAKALSQQSVITTFLLKKWNEHPSPEKRFEASPKAHSKNSCRLTRLERRLCSIWIQALCNKNL